MLSKLNRCLSAFFFAFLLFSSVAWTSSSRQNCETPVLGQVLIEKKYAASSVKYMLTEIQSSAKLNENQAKGKLGELLARDVIETKGLPIKPYKSAELVSISTLFRNKGCTVQEGLRDGADRGIDDIFVVVKNDGWIDRRYNPIFHEAKFNGNCALKLENTKTMCQQLSFQWLTKNLEKAKQRTNQAELCLKKTKFRIYSCHSCVNEFRQNIEWLFECLKAGSFFRTASVLCGNGDFHLHEVLSQQELYKSPSLDSVTTQLSQLSLRNPRY